MTNNEKILLGGLAVLIGFAWWNNRNKGPLMGTIGDKYFFVAQYDLNYQGKPARILWMNSRVFDSFKKAKDGSRVSNNGRYLYERVSQTKAREIIAFEKPHEKDARSKRETR